MKRQRMMIAFIILAGLFAIVRVFHLYSESVRDSYRISTAGGILVHYLKSTQRWPQGWDDLQRHAAKNKNVLGSITEKEWAELHQRIKIDFDFAPSSCDTSSVWSDRTPQVAVISTKEGRTTGAVGNPNQAIYLYLKTIGKD